MKISRSIVAATAIFGCMTSQSAWAGDKQDTESVIVRANVRDGSNLQGCRFVDTVFGRAVGGVTYQKDGGLKAKADAAESAIALGANTIVLTGVTLNASYLVVMANAYSCPA